MASGARSIWRFLFRRDRVERELDAELAYHVDRQTELNVGRGMSPSAARRAALVSLGGLEPEKEKCREARVGRAIEVFWQDLRYGLRVLRKNPGYAIAAIVTLGLGIGANTAIFSLIYGVFLRPLPYRDGSRLVVVHQQAPLAHVDDMRFSPMEFEEYRSRNHTMTDMVEHHQMAFLLIGKDSAERVDTSVVSVNFFDVLGVKPLLGRTFVPEDGHSSSNAVLVLSYRYWQSHLRGDPNIIGRVFQMNNLAHTVIGVLPPIPQYPVESDVYMPTWQCPFRSNPANIAQRNYRLLTGVFGRLKPGVTAQQAQADLEVIAHQAEAANPGFYPANQGHAVVAAPLETELTRTAQPAFLALTAVAGFVLLIACANVANMMLARLLKLERELTVRAALGAGRGRLVRQLLTESVLISGFGGLFGLALAPAALRVMVQLAQGYTTRAAEVRIDLPVLLFTLGASLVAGLLFGLAPALSPWHRSAALHDGVRGTASRGRQLLRGGLVVAQVAVSFLLLTGAGLMIRSFLKLGSENPGIQPAGLLTLRINPGFNRYLDFDSLDGLFDRILHEVDGKPGVESAAFTTTAPFSPAAIASGPAANFNMRIEGQPDDNSRLLPPVDQAGTDAAYFATVKQPLVRGRYFTEHDDAKSMAVAIINQSTAEHRWPNADPVGRRVTFDRGKTWITIVGVVGDAREHGLGRVQPDTVYFPRRQHAYGPWLVARTSGDPRFALAAVRTAIHKVDPLIAIDSAATVDELEYKSMASPRLMAVLMGLFAGLALLISASGIAAVMALAVSQRTRELGIRMALGATRQSVAAMVLKQGLRLTLAGGVAGIAGSVLLTRLLRTLLYETSPTDALTFAAVSVVFLGVAGAACLAPARRVTSIDPLIALRQE